MGWISRRRARRQAVTQPAAPLELYTEADRAVYEERVQRYLAEVDDPGSRWEVTVDAWGNWQASEQARYGRFITGQVWSSSQPAPRGARRLEHVRTIPAR
jgi:hypothetical protein